MQNRKRAFLKVILFFNVIILLLVNLYYYFKRDNILDYTYTLKLRVKNNYYDNTLGIINNWCNEEKSKCDVVSYRNEDVYVIEYKIKSQERLNRDSITDVLKNRYLNEDYFNQYYNKIIFLDSLITSLDSILLKDTDQLRITEKIDLSYKKLMLLSTKYEFDKEFQILFPVEENYSKQNLLGFHIKVSVITVILLTFSSIIVLQIFKT